MDLPESAFKKVYVVIYFVTWFSSVLQIAVFWRTSVKIWRSRKAFGISINFLLLCIVAFLFKYVDHQMNQLKIPAVLDLAFFVQYLGRIFLLISMVPTILISVYFAIFNSEEFEDKFNIWCFPVGYIVSFILGADHYGGTVKDIWMIGSYLEVIAWIPQFELSLIRKSVDSHVMFFIVTMFIYEILNITGLSYDFYRHSLYGNIGYKLVILKVLLFCGFFLSYCKCTPPTKNKVNKVLPVTPAQAASKENLRSKKGSEKPVYCIRVEDDVSLTEKGLMTRY